MPNKIQEANVLNAATGVGGYNLKGDGVVIGIGDNADPQYHVDFTGRLIILDPPVIFIMVHMYMAPLEAAVLLVNNLQVMLQNQL